MKIKLSKSQWERIGSETGWSKTIEAKKKKKKWNPNPWAVCHTTVDKDEEPEKYERCVQKVKEKQSSNDKQVKKADYERWDANISPISDLKLRVHNRIMRAIAENMEELTMEARDMVVDKVSELADWIVRNLRTVDKENYKDDYMNETPLGLDLDGYSTPDVE